MPDYAAFRYEKGGSQQWKWIHHLNVYKWYYQRKPYICADAWYVSYTCRNHICNQWYRNGTYYNSSSCSIQTLMISMLARNFYSGQSAYAGIYRSCSIFCNSCTVSDLQGFIPFLYESLGIYIPLIVVNCIILGRAEVMHPRNRFLPSIFDGLGMGLGFTVVSPVSVL